MTIRKAYTAEATQLGPRTIRVICSTSAMDLSGEIVEQSGIDLTGFKANPICLWGHDPDHPIGLVTSIGIANDQMTADIEFAPEGISPTADTICGLVKHGIVKGISIGFDPIESVPMNPAKPKGPQRYVKCALMEVSVVSIPANPEAEVIQRAKSQASKEPQWKCAAATDLPLKQDGDWDGSAAQNDIFDMAGFNDDKPDADMARKAFLAYDAAAPTLRGSYKLPFAMVVDGKLTAMASGIRAAASRLPDTDIPDDVRTAARKVLDGYEGKMTEKNIRARVRKAHGKAVPVTKDLREVAGLCCTLEWLGYHVESAKIEAALEGDGSQVPAMLLDAAMKLQEAFIAMAQEEGKEFIANITATQVEDDLGGLPDDQVEIVLQGKTPAVQKFRIYKARARIEKEGRKISADTAACIKEAMDMHDEAMDLHRKAMALHAKCMKGVSDLLPEAGSAQDGNTDTVPGAGSAQNDKKALGALTTKAARMARAIELAPLDEAA
jgi:HK97 family phage prohead protease